MVAITKKTLALWVLLVPFVAILSFLVGRKHQELFMIYDQYALFMNLSGDYVNELNKTLDTLETEEENTVLYNFNRRVINDFGCAPWIHHVADMEEYNLEVFKSAVQHAFENSGPIESLDEECLSNLRRYSILQ